MVQNQAIAEELAQEVFLRVYRSRSTYEPTAKFTTWLFRIATHLALNSLRDGRTSGRRNGWTTIGDMPARQLPDGKRRSNRAMVYRARWRKCGAPLPRCRRSRGQRS